MTNYNNNMNKAPFYRPTSMGSIRFHEPVKAQLIEAYFGRELPNNCIPTVNITYGIISDTMSHITKANECGYVGEILAVRRSCENGNPVRLVENNKNYPQLNGCIMQYAADVTIGILRDIMAKNPQKLSVAEQYDNRIKEECEKVYAKAMKEKQARLTFENLDALEEENYRMEERIKELEKMHKELSKENKKIKRENRKLIKEVKTTTKELKNANKKLDKISAIVNN